jgi:hypothetical protein
MLFGHARATLSAAAAHLVVATCRHLLCLHAWLVLFMLVMAGCLLLLHGALLGAEQLLRRRRARLRLLHARATTGMCCCGCCGCCCCCLRRVQLPVAVPEPCQTRHHRLSHMKMAQ